MKILPRLVAQITFLRESWRRVSENWLVSLVNKFVPLLFMLSLTLLLWKARDLPPLLPLWYAQPWGEEQLAHPGWLLVLPATTILAYLMNVAISAYLTKEHLVFTQLLYATSLLVALLSFVTLAKILFLVS